MKYLVRLLVFLCMPILPMEAHAKSMKNPTAIIETTLGSFTIELFQERAPETVANFIGLADGTKEWTGQSKKGTPLYDGTIFHRVIPGFMVQGGDPQGNGTGGPGYRFKDEFKSDDSFDKEGILAMANAGPNTNGSQFFITVAPTPWLNGKHTIFGRVTKGMDVVKKIENAPKDSGNTSSPNPAIKIIHIKMEK